MSAHDNEMEVDENDATVNCTQNSITTQERKLRYKALLDDVASLDNDENNDLATIDRACQLVEVTESLNQTKNADSCVKHPWEGFLDSKVLLATSNMVIRCTEAVSGNTNMYDADALAEHIKNNPTFWDFTLPKTVPPLAYLFGTFDFEEVPIERKNRNTQRKSQLPVSEASAPENLTQLENKEECSDMVGKVYALLCSRYREGGQKPISYFNCVLDPRDFGKTIENIYYISFLVRDGLVSIAVDEDGLPYIKPIPMKKRDKDKTKESNENNQFIVSIDVKKWKEAVKAFNISKAYMTLSA